MTDLLIRHGRVIDGTGTPAIDADIAITDGRITAIGDLRLTRATDTIDASGRMVTPGFIDIHTHSDLTLMLEGRAPSSVAQGITTQIAGNCGVSAAPTRDFEPYYGPLDPAMTRGLVCDWTGFDDYFQRLQQQGVGTNVATLVGHGNIRVAAMGYDDRAPTASEMDRMRALTQQAMQDGAVGLSTGLAYAPGPFAQLDELIELGKVIGE
ncbi:MAG: amidohydrolase family protein, partial [Gemmatimonadetes bacterium]|nr:amidohydrolase family protein [Gemmatimonadota bacterium]